MTIFLNHYVCNWSKWVISGVKYWIWYITKAKKLKAKWADFVVSRKSILSRGSEHRWIWRVVPRLPAGVAQIDLRSHPTGVCRSRLTLHSPFRTTSYIYLRISLFFWDQYCLVYRVTLGITKNMCCCLSKLVCTS